MNAALFDRPIHRAALLLAAAAALSACGGDGDDGREGGGDQDAVDIDGGGDTTGIGNPGTTFTELRDQVWSAAGPDAEECGIGEGTLRPDITDSDRLEADTCLAEAFVNGTDAYTIVPEADAISGTTVRSGRVIHHRLDASGLDATECENPRLSGVLGDPETPPFECG